MNQKSAFAPGTPLPPPSPRPHSFIRTWLRRLVSITLYVVLFAIVTALLPLLLPAGWIVDTVRGKRVLVRAALFIANYLLFEILGILLSFAIWLFSGVWLGASRHRFLRWNFRLQNWWQRNLFHGARRLFGWHVEITGEDAVDRGNMLLFIRHVSTADTLLAGVFICDRHGIALRYVLKDQLRWDPCVDIVGNRLPNGFVRRGSHPTEHAVAEVVRLTENLGPTDGVLIYPEGTRFTAAKKARLLARLEEKGQTAHLEDVRALEHVMPPRLAGTLALLEHAPGADVVFCTHTGFEKAMGLGHIMQGALNDITLHITFWRVSCADIPAEREARIAWLYEHWRRVDAWVGEHMANPEPAG